MTRMAVCSGKRTLGLSEIVSAALDALARFDDDELERIAFRHRDRIGDHEWKSPDSCESEIIAIGSAEIRLFARLLAITRINIDVIQHLRLMSTDQAEYVPRSGRSESVTVE